MSARIIILCAVVLVGCGKDNANSDVSNNDVSNNDVSNNDVSNEDMSSNDASNEDMWSNDVSNGDVSINNAVGPSADVLISEVTLQPAEAEFIEIWNSGAETIDLSDYFLTDNAGYTSIARGDPWAPVGTPGTDFLVQFPAGQTLDPDAVLVIALSVQFESHYGDCPDLVIAEAELTCETRAIPAMRVPANGGIGTTVGLSNGAELVMLFNWDGDTTHVLADVDYLTWGDTTSEPDRVDKTGTAGYLPDTPRGSQQAAPIAGAGESLERCSLETNETASGGNGVTGHDETSESLSVSFVVQTSPTPGAKNSCLPSE